MGWSELRQIPNEYNGDVEQIDAELLRLVQARRALAQGKRLFPPAETIEAWSARFGVETNQIRYLLHHVNERIREVPLHDPGQLLRELRIQPNLLLEIIGGENYSVQRHGMHGGGSQTKIEFMVSPALPDELDHLAFSFVPSAVFLERKVREIRLDRQVDF